MSGTDDALLAFEFAPVGLVLSHQRTVIRCNSRMCRMFGYTMGELEGRSLSRLYPSADEFDRIGAIGLERMRRENHYVDERIMKRRSGEHFWCRVRGQSLTPDNPFERSVWSFADISDIRPIVDLARASDRDVHGRGPDQQGNGAPPRHLASHGRGAPFAPAGQAGRAQHRRGHRPDHRLAGMILT
jgi:PAS domain S-box-containing protein